MVMASNYDCNPTIGGCRRAITIATRQSAVAGQQLRLQPGNRRLQTSNYDCNPTIGGCRPAITTATRQSAVAGQQLRLQPDNRRLQTCNYDCNPTIGVCRLAIAIAGFISPIVGLRWPRFSGVTGYFISLQEFLMPSEPVMESRTPPP